MTTCREKLEAPQTRPAPADETTRRLELEAALHKALREREQMEQALAESLAREQLHRQRLQFLAQADRALDDSPDLERALQRVAERAAATFVDWCAVSLLRDGRFEQVAVAHRDLELAEVASAHARRLKRAPFGDAALRAVLEAGHVTLHERVTGEGLCAAAPEEEHLSLLRALGCSSALLVPLQRRGQPFGVITLVLSEDTRRLGEDDVAIAEELARRVARAGGPATREPTRASEASLNLLIESIQDYAVFMLDPTGRVATWNTGAQRIKGYTADEIVGRHFSAFYPEQDVRAGKCERVLEAAARLGHFEDLGWRVRKDGTAFWANVIVSAIRDEGGQLVGFSKVTRDLTDRKRAEEEQAARLAAEDASRAKDEFLAMLGHELRNPLAPIVTALQLMKLRGDVRSSKEQQIIERQVKHMVRLVDDLLDVSRITRGQIELKRHAVDVRDVIAKAIEIASPMLEERRHHFDVEVPDEHLIVDADEARLAQVFANLLTNAAKYTEPGGHVVIAVSQAGSHLQGLRPPLPSSGPHALVEVRDDGVGISAELLPRVFDLFVQGTQGAERSAGGLGIGLNLVRALVHMHGGTVEARSAGAGEGSTFVVKLPLSATRRPARSDDSQRVALRPPAGGRRVLLVDDNLDALELLGEVLRAAGHDVDTAADAAEALASLRARVPDVAVLDIGLPVMDGYELAERIRSELGPRAPRLIALTGYGQPGDRARTREAGFSTHLVKPIEARQLLETLDALPTATRD